MSRSRGGRGSVALLAFALVPALALCGEPSAASPRCADATHRTSGQTIEVPAGGDLQAALDAARPGDTLSLAAGATFVGPFVLPRKRGADWITVRGAAVERLPPSGTRVSPSDAPFMPKLEAASGAVLTAASGAHHYKLVGIEIRPMRGTFLANLVRLGADRERRAANTPSSFVVDRCYLHGDADLGSRRGIALNSSCSDVLSSYFSDFKQHDADSQAIAGWSGPGPYRIVNNYLEAAGENVMFGGADPAIPGLVPSDIEIRGNHFAKPLTWKKPDPAGPAWSVKNLFELKNARRVLVEGNLFENNWVQSQNGFAVLLTVRNQEGHAPWSTVEDVTFRHNVVRHSASGISILGRDDNWPSQQARRIRIEHNLFDDIGGPAWGGGGTLLQLVGGAAEVVVDHNTAFHTDNVIMAEGVKHTRFVFSNNIVLQNQYGIVGTGSGPGRSTLETYFPGAVVTGNVIVGGDRASYPAKNFFPARLADVGFTERARGWPRLGPTSPYRGAASDGSDVGADPDALPRFAFDERPQAALGARAR